MELGGIVLKFYLFEKKTTFLSTCILTLVEPLPLTELPEFPEKNYIVHKKKGVSHLRSVGRSKEEVTKDTSPSPPLSLIRIFKFFMQFSENLLVKNSSGTQMFGVGGSV